MSLRAEHTCDGQEHGLRPIPSMARPLLWLRPVETLLRAQLIPDATRPSPSQGQPERRWWQSVLAFFALAVVVFTAAALWVWWQQGERRALLELPPAERQAIYARTFEAAQRLCSLPGADSFHDECRRQAEFLSLFPECDQACQRLVDPYVRPTPTR
jgi:hypothetical protein